MSASTIPRTSRRVAGVASSSTTTSANPAPESSSATRSASLERERSGNARRRHRRADLGADRVEHDAQPRVALPRPPHRQRNPAAGAQNPVDLADGARRVGREHEALAAQHDVVRAVRLLDLLEVEHARAHIGESARLGARCGDRRHLGDDVGQHDLASWPDPLRRRQSHPTGAAGQLENTFAWHSRLRQLEHLGRHRGAACVDVVRVFAPTPCDRRPHAVDAGSGSRRLCTTLAGSMPTVLCHRQFRYSLRVMNSSID